MNMHDESFIAKYNKIKFDMSAATLQDVEDILNHYDSAYSYNIDPLAAASLNARYKELTGKDHAKFLQEQVKFLNKMVSAPNLIVDGKPNIYQRLMNNLTGRGMGVSVFTTKKGSYIDKFNEIKFDISDAKLEDVNDILNHYDQGEVLISGIVYHFKPDVLYAASLNARYKELTGKDHAMYSKMQNTYLDEEMKHEIKTNGDSIYKRLKENRLSIGNNKHVLNRQSDIIMHTDKASLEDIKELLNYYNEPVLIDGVVHHGFNDPIAATKLNSKYRALTNQNHEAYISKVPMVIDGILKDKDFLIQHGVYSKAYFDTLEEIKNSIQMMTEVKSKTSTR